MNLAKTIMWILVGSAAMAVTMPIEAQITSITGRIKDATDAVVPKAAVTLRNEGTNQELKTVTTKTGDFTFAHLSPGIYDVSVTASGFNTAQQVSIHLDLDAIATVDLVMKPGARTDVVTVHADELILNHTNADRGQTFTQDEIENSPLNGGVPLLLANTAPGVEFTGTNNGVNQWVRPFDNSSINQFSTNGQGSDTNDFQIDGSPNNSNSFGSRDIGYVPPSASIQEMKFISNPYDSQYGHTGGGVFDMVTKYGTNTLHGQVYENARRTWLDANTHYNDNPQINLAKTSDTRDQYGFEVDGPLWVPRVYNGHGKTFFEAQGENWSQNTPKTGTAWVPPFSPNSTTQTVAQTGDFSAADYYDGSCQCRKPITIYDPLTTDPTTKIRQAFSGNQIPTSRLNSTALAYLSYLPLPNRTTAADQPYGSNNYAFSATETDRYKTAIIRLDQNFTDKDRAYIRFAWNKRFQNVGDTYFGIPGPAARGIFPLTRQNHFFTVDETHTFSSNILFDMHLSFTRYAYNQNQGPSPFDISKIGLGSLSGTVTSQVFPEVDIDGVTGFGDWAGNGGNKLSITNTISSMPILTVVHGSHTMKMGLDYRWMKASNFTGAASSGYFHESVYWTQQETYQNLGAQDGNAIASWVLGTPADGHLDINPKLYFSYPYFAPFFQDDWKLTSKLTVNLGLRWDFQGPPAEARNQIVGAFNTTAQNPVTVGDLPAGVQLNGGLTFAGVNGQPNTIYKWNKGLVQPRVGFAYALDDKTVFRAGVGDTFEQSSAQGDSQGFSQTTGMTTSISNGTLPDGNSISNPFPVVALPVGAGRGLETSLGNSFNVSNRSFKIPGVWNYSAGFTRQLNSHSSIDLSYVGSRGFNQDSTDNINHVSEAFQASCDILHGATVNRLIQCLNAGNNSAWAANPFLGNAAFSPVNTGNQNGYYTSQLLPASVYTRPFPEFGDIYQTEQNDGRSSFNSLQVSGTHRWNDALTLHANYVWSKVMTSGYLEDSIYRTHQHHIDTGTRPWRYTVNAVWHLPVGRGRTFLRNSNYLVDAVLGGWIASPIYYYEGGTPVSIPSSIMMTHVNRYRRQRTVEDSTHSNFIRGTTNCVGWYDPNNNYTLGNIPGQDYSVCSASSGYDFIVLPPFAQTNDISDTGIRNPNGQQLDLAMSKTFPVYERVKLEMRFESYNVLNHPSWQGQSYWWGTNDPHFGTINMIYNQQSNPSRQIQLSGKISW